jgi:O-antigen/teichoic acid export membrane protein
MILMMKGIIIHWVGKMYIESIVITQILLIQLLLNFILMPVSYLIMSKEKYKAMIFISGFSAIFYLSLFYLLHTKFGYIILPILKSIVLLFNSFYSIYLVKNVFKINVGYFFIRCLLFLIFPLITLLSLISLANNYWLMIANDKNINFLVHQIIAGIFINIICISIYYFTKPEIRVHVFRNFKFSPKRIF